MSASFPLWLIPLLPLLGAIVNGALSLAGARSANGPARGFVALIAVLAPALSFLCVLMASYRVDAVVPIQNELWTWFSAGNFHLGFDLLFDRLTSMMLLFVTGIGSLIHLYSVGYMWEDRGFARFMAYMNLFMFSMIVLVLGGSLPVTFLGWEGVGLCSYLLIGFWHKNNDYNDAARKAFVMNRIGDLGFLLGAFALFGACGSLGYVDIAGFFAKQDPAVTDGIWTLAALLIFLGCTGKSAQIPLLTWLPDAMAGPTPVSALIHAATMVTSGVYLVSRLGGLYSHCPQALTVILVVGCLTALYGAVCGLFQNDIKKAFAYSTVSQLGYMFMACGVAAYDVALFHVLTHAFFKATLFLGAGAIIHSLHHEQDMRKYGALHKLVSHGHRPLYLTYVALVLAWWSILGLPLGSGFMSKDLIIEHVFGGHATMHGIDVASLVGVVALVTAGITAVYMTRVMYLTFWSADRVPAETREHVQRVPVTMAAPVLILGCGSILVGYLWFEMASTWTRGCPFPEYLMPIFHPSEFARIEAARLAANGADVVQVESGHTDWVMTGAAVALAVIGWVVAAMLWRKGPRGPGVAEQPSSDPTGFGASWTWAFDRVYHALVVLPTRWIALILYWVIEQMLIGGLTYAVAEFAAFLGDGYASVQRPRLRASLALSIAGAAAVLWIAPLSSGLNHVWTGLGRVLRAFY
jgi:NADH-quinone oxidoreductase subunit L